MMLWPQEFKYRNNLFGYRKKYNRSTSDKKLHRK